MEKRLINHPNIVLIIGGRGQGKSALSHNIIERFHNERNIPVYVVSPPQLHNKLSELLPEWITITDDIGDAPEDCIILVDEAAIRYHSHRWRKKETEVMDVIISVSRQKKQTIIFVTHTMRKFAITLLLDIDVLLCKKPSLLHSKLERSEVRKLIEEVTTEFRKLPKDEVKKNTYVITEDYKGFIRNSLCSYWSEELSEAFAGIPLENNKKEQTEENDTPLTIPCGLKIWFKKKDTNKVLKILSKNSEIDGILSEMGVQCSDGKCFYSFDLRKGKDGKYHPSNKKFDIEASIGEFKEKNVPIILDVESAYPLNKEDVDLNIEKIIKEEKEDKLTEFAKKLKL